MTPIRSGPEAAADAPDAPLGACRWRALQGDSPRLSRMWFEVVRTSGLLGCITQIFGERPITSLDKATLRRINAGAGIEWHQDGAFLGPGSGAINVWVELTDCTDASGLEIVPRRFDRIVETGTGGSTYDWFVGPEVVDEFTRDVRVQRPHPVSPADFQHLALTHGAICIGGPAVIQPGMRIPHGQVVVNGGGKIAGGIVLSPFTTLGLVSTSLGERTIETVSAIGTGAKVLGPVTVGAWPNVDPNSVVLTDVPPGATAVGAPARVVAPG